MNEISVFLNEQEKNYIFIGDYEDLLAFKNKKSQKDFNWSEWSVGHGGGLWDF